MSVLRSLCSATLLAALTLCTLPAFAASSTEAAQPAVNAQQAAEPQNKTAVPAKAEPSTKANQAAKVELPAKVELQRNPDAACTRCHKQQKDELHGKHASALNPSTQLSVTCTNCHGPASVLHRDGVKDVMRFNNDMFKAAQAMYSPAEQNSACMSCHKPEKLQAAFWPHDAHVLKISCASCHQLHPKTDPMKGLDDKGRIKLCVDCHGRQQELIQKGKP